MLKHRIEPVDKFIRSLKLILFIVAISVSSESIEKRSCKKIYVQNLNSIFEFCDVFDANWIKWISAPAVINYYEYSKFSITDQNLSRWEFF